jgi:K+-transporting ATPase ATPase C chain
MLNHIRPALTMILLFTALLGLGYPLAITGIAGAVFPAQAGGSLVTVEGRAVGSALIGQSFTGDIYFRGRPSATAETAYNGAASSGTNLGPTSAKLRDMIAGEVAKLQAEGAKAPLPADAATASGSGLDPEISPAFAAL